MDAEFSDEIPLAAFHPKLGLLQVDSLGSSLLQDLAFLGEGQVTYYLNLRIWLAMPPALIHSVNSIKWCPKWKVPLWS